MTTKKQEIINRLQKQILQIQGYKTGSDGPVMDFGLGDIVRSFPNQIFPTAALHEFLSISMEDAAATGGFISALLSVLMENKGPCLWISTGVKIFPPALIKFGIAPDRIIFIDLQREKDVLWATEEALKCSGLSAVITEINEISFAQSRRLQLVIEKSRVTGFIIRQDAEKMGSTTAVARWKISPVSSGQIDDLPGLGFPRWEIELLKVKNGLLGKWVMEYSNGNFRSVNEEVPISEEIKTAI